MSTYETEERSVAPQTVRTGTKNKSRKSTLAELRSTAGLPETVFGQLVTWNPCIYLLFKVPSVCSLSH